MGEGQRKFSEGHIFHQIVVWARLHSLLVSTSACRYQNHSFRGTPYLLLCSTLGHDIKPKLLGLFLCSETQAQQPRALAPLFGPSLPGTQALRKLLATVLWGSPPVRRNELRHRNQWQLRGARTAGSNGERIVRWDPKTQGGSEVHRIFLVFIRKLSEKQGTCPD